MTAAAASIAAVVLVACGAGSSDGSGAPPASKSSASTAVPRAARIVATSRVSGRMRDLTVDSPAVRTRVKVRLLLPARFSSAPTRQWPVLYLLHGCCDSYLSWTRSTDIERFTQNLDALVVMPAGGKAGFYSNWRSGPAWETFHLTELDQVLVHTYRAGTRRVIAGVSMGGLGAIGYAARHPGMFTVAASFSGIVHTRLSEGESHAYLALVGSQGDDPLALWGDPTTNADVWREHNPFDLAARLRGTRLFVSAGNGQPGPLDPPHTPINDTEVSINEENTAFVQQVRTLRLDAQIDLYGPGTHTWPYWQRELHKAWPLITSGLGIQ